MPRGIYEHRNASLETRKKISRSMMGHAVSPETRVKMSAAAKRHPSNFRGHKHTAEARAKQSATHIGRKNSPEARVKMSLAAKAWMAIPENREMVAEAAALRLERMGYEDFTYTSLHLDLANFLLDVGFELVSEVRFGRYCVDLYDPVGHIAFEADGKYWHDSLERIRPGYHSSRDAYLLAEHGLPVVHFTEAEIKGFSEGDVD